MKIRRVVFALMPLLAGVLVGAATHGEPEPACVLADRWISAHADELPSTIAEISDHPMARRKAILMALPIAQQIALWREQFVTVGQAPDLTQAQREFLRAASERFEGFILAARSSEKGSSIEGLDAFGSEALALFGRERAFLIFANIGVNTLEERAPMEEQGGNCTCNDGPANFCGSQHWVRCADPWETQCSVTAHGCGWGLVQECNGKCVFGIGE